MLNHLSNTDLGEILNDDGRFEEVVNDIKQKIAEKFLSGDTEVDEFLELFLTRRKIMHLRKMKVDKMREETEIVNRGLSSSEHLSPPKFS
ncbi:vacuolar protein sorting-associated protein 37B-like isoform X2 [Fopius arisanus]|uniref:Vacuolar protein sorting-associated protein 37B-like isoform X2 n=1 Tax=Fopius arisanus TaxID=64838 RepID=A0A9R1TUD3_9HYME|nr:PREDICTED: vacuolar protein sorting-associated protein 37B-like isoform X2 [Fopius arisanus]